MHTLLFFNLTMFRNALRFSGDLRAGGADLLFSAGFRRLRQAQRIAARYSRDLAAVMYRHALHSRTGSRCGTAAG
jgi:hypothetical protein